MKLRINKTIRGEPCVFDFEGEIEEFEVLLKQKFIILDNEGKGWLD